LARPLREQFTIATLILLVPVGAVMTYAAGAAYQAQVQQVGTEAVNFAQTIAAHIDATDPPGAVSARQFIEALPLPRGSVVLIADSAGSTLLRVPFPPESAIQPLFRPAQVRTRPWTVGVGFPAPLAWERAGPNYRRTIEISGLATIILLIMQAVFLRRWLPALASLERSVAQVGAGDFRVLMSDKMPSRELEHLRDAFHDMVEKLRTAREAIDQQMEEERRMRVEVESLQQQVIRQERLAAIGVLVSGIAHELNNPLQTISGFSELLQHD